ncbi:hypothetical protein [Bdellovibrio sp. HCB-162]|uniref:HVO_A0114 family putative DNA-binding protein n=1 Tax=Bdellovibrio sp. HCB-162 TaxID=3394234 RepID=UPI0039BCD7D5
MKKLIISMKSSSEALSEFKQALKSARKGKLKKNHYEISFDNKKDFDRFIKNIGVLSTILIYKPKSVYELAKIIHMDVSNLNKIILFFEDIGAIKITEARVQGRWVKTPTVEYDQIQFDLKAA